MHSSISFVILAAYPLVCGRCSSSWFGLANPYRPVPRSLLGQCKWTFLQLVRQPFLVVVVVEIRSRMILMFKRGRPESLPIPVDFFIFISLFPIVSNWCGFYLITLVYLIPLLRWLVFYFYGLAFNGPHVIIVRVRSFISICLFYFLVDIRRLS